MKKIITFLLIGCVYLGYTKDSTTQSGDWETNSTWSKGVEPTTEDTLVVETSHTLTLTSNLTYSTVVHIHIKGTFDFSNGKLRLPSGSTIFIDAAALLTNGGGNSDKIYIDGNLVWDGDDGNLTGSYTIDENGVVLPVKWGKINITKENQDILLSWETLMEENNDYFEILVSDDLEIWDIIDEVSSNYSHHYTYLFHHENCFYLKLKQVDYSGHYSFSKIKYYNDKKKLVKHYLDNKGSTSINKPKCNFYFEIYSDNTVKKIIQH